MREEVTRLMKSYCSIHDSHSSSNDVNFFSNCVNIASLSYTVYKAAYIAKCHVKKALSCNKPGVLSCIAAFLFKLQNRLRIMMYSSAWIHTTRIVFNRCNILQHFFLMSLDSIAKTFHFDICCQRKHWKIQQQQYRIHFKSMEIFVST